MKNYDELKKEYKKLLKEFKIKNSIEADDKEKQAKELLELEQAIEDIEDLMFTLESESGEE